MGNRTKTTSDASKARVSSAAATLARSPIVAKTWADLLPECAGFMAKRFRCNLELQRDMMTCKSPWELFQVQSEYFKNSIDQYVEEATRFSEMSGGPLKSSVDALRSANSSKYDDVPV